MPETTPVQLPTDEILVGGRWRQGRGAPIVPTDPATGATLTTVHGASVEDVDDAVAAGLAAADDPAWRDLLPHVRARYLTAVGDLIDRDRDMLAALQTANTGKTVKETTALVASAANTFRYAAAVLETMEDVLTPPRGDYLTMSMHEPIGVVGAITPWNSPIASDAQKMAPALAAGNAVVLKPAEWTPLVALALGRLCVEAGLPEGIVSVLPGRGSVVGDAIVRHPGVGKVSFTGGTTTGRGIAHIAADKLMPVSLELGGKSPTIVMPDADIERALAGVMYGVYSSTGQSCIAGSRLFVHKDIYEDFVGELVARTTRLRVGPGTDPRTQVAPMVTHKHRDSVAGYVDLARSEGGDVRVGGEAPSDPALAAGAYYTPTVITGLDNSARTCQEEIFGPVLVALPFTDEADLLRQANDSVYGLASGIWTADYRTAWRIGRRLAAGTVWVNTYKMFSASTPFGGMKDSGLGREKGREGVRQYMNQKSFYWGMSEHPIAWSAS